MDTIKNRWEQSAKLMGNRSAVTLADGETLQGCYYLAESGSCTASHNALQGFERSEGFPTDPNGGSVNDRDYQRDQDAQRITRNIAAAYDSRALGVIVSPDGVVLSGNGRTMAGELAARDNTDGVYIKHLTQYCAQYGFTSSQVEGFAHPRLLFVLDDCLPYTAQTFARFNAQETKKMSKTEQAIKYGKTVQNDVFGRILSVINGFDTLGDFYACTEAVTRCINDLQAAGVIDSMSYAEMFDGDTVSAIGRETLENILTGKAFAADPDAARKITSYKSLRKSVVFALSEVVNNLGLGDDYTLNKELTQAINLAYVARQHGYKAGERVSMYARQLDVFTAETICDYKDTVILGIADALNSEQVTALKKIMAIYNHQAQDAASGQTDMFCTSGVKSKADILEEIKAFMATSSTKEQEKAVNEATKARTAQNLFIPEELSTKLQKGSYARFMTHSGDVIVCFVSDISRTIANIECKDGVKMWCDVRTLTPTADHVLNFPSWLQPGSIITDGHVSQRIESISDGYVLFEWVNGGLFDMSIGSILQNFKPSDNNFCGIIEAA